MITNVEYFIPKLKEMYPNIAELDIRRAVNFGWRRFYFYNLRNLDTLVSSLKHHFWFYCGRLTSNSIRHFGYYCGMLQRKLRILYKHKDDSWDGYYYFGLNDEEYEQLVGKRKGRKPTYFTYKQKICYKVLDEAKVAYHWAKAIVRVQFIVPVGYSILKKDWKCKRPEVVETRDKHLTFKDILISSNNYDLI